MPFTFSKTNKLGLEKFKDEIGEPESAAIIGSTLKEISGGSLSGAFIDPIDVSNIKANDSVRDAKIGRLAPR